MRGFPTLRGSRLVDPDQDWSEDAPAVARLREAGAVIFGKTTTPEFGWKALGDSPLTGITRNPWDLSRTPGGSSAGAAAACAAGIGPLHLGSDGAGSIRIPRRIHRDFRVETELRAGAGLPALGDGPARASRPDGADRRRCGADAERAVRTRPSRSLRSAARRHATIATGSRMAYAAGGSPIARRSATQRSIPRLPMRSPKRYGNSRRSARSSKRSVRSFRHRARRCSHYGRRVRPSFSTAIPRISARWSTRDWSRRRLRASGSAPSTISAPTWSARRSASRWRHSTRNMICC